MSSQGDKCTASVDYALVLGILSSFIEEMKADNKDVKTWLSNLVYLTVFTIYSNSLSFHRSQGKDSVFQRFQASYLQSGSHIQF